MKARLHPTPAMQKAIDAYAEAKIQGIQCRAQEAVMKERAIENGDFVVINADW